MPNFIKVPKIETRVFSYLNLTFNLKSREQFSGNELQHYVPYQI